MASIRRLHALWVMLLLITGCASTGAEKQAEPAQESAAAQSTASESGADTAGGQTVGAPLSAEQREALDSLLALMRAGEWLTAREMAQELIMAHPMLAEAYANMGNIQLQLEEPEKAEQAWLKALEVRPGWAPVANQLGVFYREQGRFDESLAMYQLALQSDERYAKAHRNIAILYEIYRAEFDKALQHYQRYLELLGGEDREVSMWIADLERRVKRTAQ